MIEWISNNKEWFFSGLGIFLLSGMSALIKWVIAPRFKLKNADTELNNPIPALGNNQTQSQQVTVNVQPTDPTNTISIEAKKLATGLTIEGMRAQTNILFIDDDKKFKIVSIIKSTGWKNTSFFPNPDVKDINDERIRKAHIIFVDILGVGQTLYEDEGLGLAASLKKKYPEKKIVIYSAEPAHKSFHEAWKITDDRIQKNAQPAEFISCIETLADSIWKKE